jgi:hypothetical protein
MAKDYIRFCKKCDHQWRVSKAVAKLPKAPGGMEMTGRKMMAAGSSMTIGSRQRAADQLRLANAESRAQAAAATSQCPACGSGKFKQMPEGWQSRQETDRIAKKASKLRGKARKSAAKAEQKRASSKATEPPGPAPTFRSTTSATPNATKPTVPLVPPPPGTPQGWQADPTGRHELRWWTGSAYAANVSDGGRTSLDAI